MCFQMLPKLSIAGDLSYSKDRGQTYDEMIEDSCPQAQPTRGGGEKQPRQNILRLTNRVASMIKFAE